ncbi:MAG TPA: hypothetical protein PLM62_01040 [Zoogloea sp.]|nr:hypothetical protein [Zoogloea sp.]
MRRFLAILLMFLMPLQVTWAAAAALHGHFDDDETVSLYHVHDHDHYSVAHHDDGDEAARLLAADNHDADHHEGHFHPAFTMFVVEARLNIATPQPAIHPPWPLQSFSSHIPPLFDRPPLALR